MCLNCKNAPSNIDSKSANAENDDDLRLTNLDLSTLDNLSLIVKDNGKIFFLINTYSSNTQELLLTVSSLCPKK